MPELDENVSSSSCSEDGDIFNLADDEGWEDLEPDVEAVSVQCLICSICFNSIKSMLEHSNNVHELDLPLTQKTLREHT